MKIALDWTPNAMHAGLFVAQAKGWLDVEFISPATDECTVMPADKLLRGEVDFSIGPPETFIQPYLAETKPQLLAVAPLLHKNTSAFAALKSTNIRSVADWQGKNYAALAIPFEQEILRRMSPASFETMHVSTPLKLSTWQMLLNGETDLTWIFEPVEGAEAAYKEIDLTYFRLEDAGIPYPPCPLLTTSRNLAEAAPDLIEQLLKTAGRGYQYAIDYPEETVEILRKGDERLWMEDPRLLLHVQRAISPYYLDAAGSWGKVDSSQLQAFADWLYRQKIVRQQIPVASLMVQPVINA